MTRSSLSAFMFALLVAGSLAGPGSIPVQAQGYRDGDRDRDRGRDDSDRDRRRDDRRGGRDDDDDDRDWRRDRGGFRFEFGNRDRERRCYWVSRRYVDDDGDVVIRRRRVCD
jgi:hypothetical protein